MHWQRSFAWGFAAAYNLRFFEADFTFRGGFAFKKDRAGPLKIPAQRFASLRHLHPAASCAGGRKDFANPGSRTFTDERNTYGLQRLFGTSSTAILGKLDTRELGVGTRRTP